MSIVVISVKIFFRNTSTKSAIVIFFLCQINSLIFFSQCFLSPF
uniref:Uncharacterized protein n=1 Tax=Siphoviridae sp. ctXZx16 TaxID=2826371 RepID=A0A8S5MLW4_9CAUD|nr:MAG TPA: hypothetical protein [Siphoviridae sp. ctXZx16]